MSDSCKPPFLVITKEAPLGGETNAYYVYMKEHPNPKKKGVYVVDTTHPLNEGNLTIFPDLIGNEYVLKGHTIVDRAGRRRSKKAPTARRRRSSKARKARATRRK
jgi:hypothetical protein